MATNKATAKSETATTPEVTAKPDAKDQNVTVDQPAANDEVYNQAKIKDDVCFVTGAGPDSLTTNVIEKPAAGEALEVAMVAGQKYFLDMYEKDVVSFELQGENLKLVFSDGSSILLVGYALATQGDLASTMAFRDDFSIADVKIAEAAPEQLVPAEAKAEPSAEQVAKIEPAAGEDAQIAQQVAAIEPKAGEEASGGVENTGFTFTDAQSAQIASLNAIGALGATALNYGVNFRNDPVRLLPEAPVAADSSPEIIPARVGVDETDLSDTSPLGARGTVTVDFGDDGPGTLTPSGTFTFSGAEGNQLTSCGEPITVTATPNGYVGTITVDGVTTTIFTLNLDPNTGSFVFQQFGAMDHADPTNPDDTITLNFGVTATDADGDSATTNIQVLVRDDGPVANNDVNNFSAQAQGQDFNVVMMLDVSGSMEGEKLALLKAAVANLFADLNGYTGGDVMVHLVPFSTDTSASGTFNLSTPEGYAAALAYLDSLEAGGLTNYEAPLQDAISWLQSGSAIPGAQTYTYFVSDGAPNVYMDDNGNWVFGGDDGVILGEITGSDGTNEVAILQGLSTEVIGVGIGVNSTTLNILDIIDSDGNALDVQDPNDLTAAFQGTIPLQGSASGNVMTGQNGGSGAGDDQGADGAAVTSVTFNGVTYAVDPQAGVTIQGLNGVLVMQADGSYTYRLNPNATPVNGVIRDQFTYTLTDCDGDQSTATLTLQANVGNDDRPIIAPPAQLSVDETNLNPVDTANGVLNVNFGNDGPGTFSAIGSAAFSHTGQAGTVLTSNGMPVVVSLVNGAYVGTANGAEVFRLTLNPTTGAYSFTLTGTLDHADPNNPDDAIRLSFGVRATDADGDSATTTIQVIVRDDGPVAVDDAVTVASDAVSVSANVLDNDDVGEDVVGPNANGLVVNVTFNGVDYPVVQGTTTTITGQYGTLEISANGSYVYTPFGTNTTQVQDQFTYTIRDFDGDRDNAVLTVSLAPRGDDVPVIINPAPVVVDETNLPNGSTASGQFNVNYGADGPGTLASNGTFSSSTALTSGGNPVTVTATPNGYVGTITVNGVTTTVFTLSVNNNGAYTFTQNEQIDHPNPNNPNDPIRLNFGIRATDSDGDSANGTIIVDVLDDGPVAVDDSAVVPDNTNVVVGNVLTNDDVGEDVVGPNDNGLVVSVTFNNFIYPVVEGTPTTIVGQYGTLVINANGSYTYTASGNNTTQVQDQFIYTIRDFDGDTDTAVLTVTVRDGGDDTPELTPAISRVDETDLSGNSPIGTMGTVNVDFGNDGPGTLAPSGTFSISGSALGGQLTSNGIPVTVTATANGYVGSYTLNGVTVNVFTLNINPNNGTYVFQQFRPLDHNDPNNPDDNLNLVFGVRATDNDGDSATTTITIRVFDDGPLAVDDSAVVPENMTAITGNVVTNDDVGADGGVVQSVTFNNFIYPVVQGTPTTIVGQYGTLVINANGSYTYTAFGTNTTIVQDQFNYTIRDFDGDRDDAVLTITVLARGDDNPIIANPTPLVVDETDLSPIDTDGNVLNVNFGNDGPGTFSATGTQTFSFSGQAGQALTSNGVPVVVSLVSGAYVGTANGVEVFKLTLNPTTGAYNFTLSGTLDHGNPNNPDDAITLNFGVTATDADGDSATTNIQVLVRDDGPVANNDVNNFSAQAQGQDFNVVMMLDVSGSMAGDKITLLKAAVANLFADLNGYTGGQVMVHLVPFSTDTFASGTFDLSTPQGYQAALAYLNALETEGGLTNYEAPLQDAISWLQSGSAIPGAQTYTYFVSDGQPNVYMDDNGNWVFVGSSGLPTIIGEITGSDGTNEVALLQSLSTEVIGVGIGVNAVTLNVLNLIDSDGNALDVQDPNDLNAAFQGTIPLQGSASGNVMTGQNGGPGAGDDQGADGAAVTSVTFNGVTYAVDPQAGVTIQGLNGVLVMQADGSYTYRLNPNATPVNGVIQEQFTYTLTDRDGDQSTATLTLRATVNPPPVPDVVEHGLPVEAQPILVAHGVDQIHGDHDGEVIYGLPYHTQPIVKLSAEYTTKPPIYIKPVDGVKDDVVIRPPVIEKPVDNSKPAIKPAIKPVDIIKDDIVEHGLPVDDVKDGNHHYMDDGTVIYGLPYHTQPIVKPSAEYTTKPPIYIKPVDGLKDDVVTRPPVFEKPVDSSKPAIKPAIKPVDIIKDDIVEHGLPVDDVKDGNHHYMDDGTVIYGLPYHTQPIVKPVDSALSDDVVYTRPPVIEKPVDLSKPGFEPVTKPPVYIKPVDGIKDDGIEHGLPVEIQPVDVSKPFDAYTGKLKIDIIKDILDIQHDDVVLYADDKHINDFAVECVEDVFLGIVTGQKPFVGDFGVQPFDEEFALPADILDVSSVLHGVDALQESINDFVVSNSANDNFVAKDLGSENQDVVVFAAAFRSVSDLGLGDISEQAVSSQGRI